MRAANELRAAFAETRTLLADGATGTELQKQGLPIGEAPERWMPDHPDAITGLARSYLDAGSDLVLTNTFGANAIRLKLCGLEARVTELNTTAVRLARRALDACGRPVFLLGSIGPTGEMVEPYGDLSADEARAAFLEQARALVAAGVDGLVCETFTALEEITLALDAAREASADLPLVGSMAFDSGGCTMMGVTPEAAVAALTAAGAQVVGANCSVGPDALEAVIRRMQAAKPDARLWAKPNAGLPELINGRTVYRVAPDALAAFTRNLHALGAAVVGGCCGTTPEHIRAMRAALDRS